MANKAMIGLGLQEDVSQGMQKIEDSIEGVSGKSKELQMIGKRIDDLAKKALPPRRELKRLKDIMTSMNLNDLANTEEFTKAAIRVGQLEDAILDTNQAAKAYSDDVMTLKAGAEVFQGIAATVSIGTSAMALFGAENEKVNQMLLKVQAAQGLLNGVTSIANILNKDSFVMLKLKQIQMAINNATTKQSTVLTTANTVAQAANTVATKADTVEQTAWNTAKAIGKALLGDYSGLVLVGIGAIAAYAVATSGATEEQKKLDKATEELKKKQDEYNKSLKDTANGTVIPLYSSYLKLQSAWKLLNTEAQKKQFIKDYASEMKNLGVEVNNLRDAENLFINNQQSFIQSIKLRAKAAVLMKQLQKQLEDSSLSNNTLPNNNKNGLSNGKYSIGEAVANNTAKELAQVELEIDKIMNKFNKGGSGGKNNIKTKVEYAKGSIADLEAQLSKLQTDYKNGLLPKLSADDYKKKVDQLTKQINDKKIKLGIELSDEAKKTLEIQKENAKKLEKANEEFNKINTTYDDKPSSYDSAIKKAEQDNGIVPTNQDKLDAIREEMDYNDELIAQLEELKAVYESLGDVEGLNKVNDALGEIKSTQDVLSTQAEDIAGKTIKWEEQQKSMQEVADTASSMGSAFNSLGNAFSQAGEEGAAAAFQIMGSVAQMVSDVIPQIIKLIGTKQGEAMASGVASAAPLPFPKNIAAIATIVATIASTFSSIMSAVGAFADGGIVGGGSKIGDHMFARVNAGEMILNDRQQANLFKMINDGQEANKSNVNVVVSGKVRGKDLELVLANLNGVKKLTSGGLKF